MRGRDRRERRDRLPHTQPGDQVARVEPALRMGDDVDLFASRLPPYLINLFPDCPGIVLDGAPRLLASIIDRRAVALQFARNAAPVVEVWRTGTALLRPRPATVGASGALFRNAWRIPFPWRFRSAEARNPLCFSHSTISGGHLQRLPIMRGPNRGTRDAPYCIAPGGYAII